MPPPGRVGKGVGHLAHVWSYGVWEVVSSNSDRGNIVGLVFHPTRWLARFSLIWKCLSFQILNLFRTLSSRGSDNYKPSAPLLYEVASHVKQLPFRPYTCRHSVQFGCYITWLWMANCVSVMTKILRKRHDLRTHKQQAVSDWLKNPHSLGTIQSCKL